PDRRNEIPGRSAELAADEAEVVGAIRALRQMRESAGIARSNMARSLPDPLPADAELAGWLIEQLDRDHALTEASREEAERIRLIVGVPLPPVPEPVAAETPAPEVTEPRVEHRVCFTVDVVSYSSR